MMAFVETFDQGQIGPRKVKAVRKALVVVCRRRVQALVCRVCGKRVAAGFCEIEVECCLDLDPF